MALYRTSGADTLPDTLVFDIWGGNSVAQRPGIPTDLLKKYSTITCSAAFSYGTGTPPSVSSLGTLAANTPTAISSLDPSALSATSVYFSSPVETYTSNWTITLSK